MPLQSADLRSLQVAKLNGLLWQKASCDKRPLAAPKLQEVVPYTANHQTSTLSCGPQILFSHLAANTPSI